MPTMGRVVLLIDNYDSFTYNLVQLIAARGMEVEVRRNDEISPIEALAMEPSHVVVSPGPGRPDDAGVSKEILAAVSAETPVLGVCLGHQAIGEVFGGEVVSAPRLMHGKVSDIFHDGRGVFRGLPSPFVATRYHSLILDRSSLPDTIQVSAWTDTDEIMGIRIPGTRIEGVQFHPESILTEQGSVVVDNFLGVTDR